ncbi:hypothetical protein [Promicromonospora panici]|uniref:hypothetical protein n=1 Tax=Promicromonospora panici TaxID=2219658 RepID=UPI0013EB3A69|nr:hypothetical protein [Promicromonospora panici]
MTHEIGAPERATLARFLHLLVAVLALGGFAIELVTAIVGSPSSSGCGSGRDRA